MSATQRRSGAWGVKLRFTRSGTGGIALGARAECGASLPSTSSAPEQACLSHQTSYALPGTSYTERPQLEVYPRSTVGFMAISVDTGYLLRKQGIGLISSRRHSISPAIETTL